MTATKSVTPLWLQPIEAMIATAGRRGSFFVVFHEYRPELFRELSSGLGLAYFDFRAECMAPLGWEAGRMPLAALTTEVAQRVPAGGVVLHNAEALLATKSEEERLLWLRTFAATAWPAPIVMPVAIFQADLPVTTGRFHRVDPDDIPTETLLTRLAAQ